MNRKYNLHSNYPKVEGPEPVKCYTHKYETRNMLDWFVHMLRFQHVQSGSSMCGNCFAPIQFDMVEVRIKPEERLVKCKQCQTPNKLPFPALPPLSYLHELVDDNKITWEEFNILENESKERSKVE